MKKELDALYRKEIQEDKYLIDAYSEEIPVGEIATQLHTKPQSIINCHRTPRKLPKKLRKCHGDRRYVWTSARGDVDKLAGET